MRKSLFTAATIGMLVMSGCAATQPEASDQETAFLEPFGLEGSDAQEIVAALDQTNEDREAGLAASVRYDTVLFATPDGETELALPDEAFYVSLAPYVENTHECYYHNLASCQGELVGEDIDVTITAADGEVLVDETVTTYENGFVGFWLPKDIEGSITVAWDGLTTTAPIATGPEDPTCLTTLQLS
ncbi:MAG: CueP family metal-binding protein [Actinomycetota bacterium]